MADQVYEVVISGLLAGQFVQSVQHVRATIATPVNPFASALLIAQDLATGGIMDLYVGALPTDYQGTSLRVRRVDGGGGATAIVLAPSWSFSIGERPGNISSAQVNPLITWIPTTSVDKPGRLFMPGVSETDIDEMMLSAGLVTALQNFANGWVAGGTLGGVDEYHGTIWRRPPVSVDDLIFAGQVSPLIGTQRRRLHPV